MNSLKDFSVSMIEAAIESAIIAEVLSIPWPGTVFDSQLIVMMISLTKCFRDYTTVIESSAFVFLSDERGVLNSTVGNVVLHVIGGQRRKTGSHTVWDIVDC